jgi:predicted alpha/beta-fold hydrolase
MSTTADSQTPALLPSRWLAGGHLQTIWPSYFRVVKLRVQAETYFIPTPDADELECDWYPTEGSKGVVVVCHGLEGHSRRPYMLGMVAQCTRLGYDVLAWNYRSCGQRLNKQARFYHSGATDDLQTVLDHVTGISSLPIYLVGFSLGGNLVLRWLGERPATAYGRVQGAVAISAVIDLQAGSDYLARPAAALYSRNFLKSLKAKVAAKAIFFPQAYRTDLLPSVRSLRAFDEYFTAPIHGFAGADDYYARASSLAVLEQIQCPVLLLQAQNDPFLPPSCYPTPLNRRVQVEVSPFGGHVGFSLRQRTESYAELRALDFINNCALLV